jgi:hypothetical protein
MLEIKPSGRLLRLYLGFFIALSIAIFLLPMAFWQQSILIVSLCCYGQWLIRKFIVFSHPESIKKLLMTEYDWCYVQFKNNRIIKANISSDTVVTEYLVILNLCQQTGRSLLPGYFTGFSILILSETVGVKAFRDIKRYLRLLSLVKRPS